MRWVLTYPAGADHVISLPAGKAPLPKNWTRGPEPKRWLPVIGQSPEVSQGTRLAIYGDGYFIRIVDVMAGNYAVLCAVLGDHEFRHHVAREYLIKHPSIHKCIDNIGNFMPAFLEKHSASRKLPFLADLARLEWAFHESFYADEWPLLDGAAFKDVPIEKWTSARISLDPSVRLLALRHDVVNLWRDDGTWSARRLKGIKKTPTRVVVYRRPDAQVRVWTEPEASFALLKAFQTNQTFDAALRAAMKNGLSPARAMKLFSEWTSSGLIRKVAFR